MKNIDLLNIVIHSHDDLRKRRIAVILAWGIFALGIISLISLFLYSDSGDLFQASNLADHDFVVILWVTILTLIFSVSFLLLTKTKIPANILGSILVIGTSVILFISDSPSELVGGRSTTLLLFPVFMGAVLIHSSAALIISLLLFIPFILISGNIMEMNIYAWSSVLGLALVIWVACYIMEKAIREAREETYRSNAMLGIASHELRTPLGVILGYLAMMRLQYSSDVNPLLELIEKSACSLNEIVSRLLDQAHIQSGKVELRTCEVNIPELVQKVSDQILALAHKKSLIFSVSIKHHVPENVAIDPLRVGQILVNLLENAVKYTNTGSVSLTVDFHAGKSRKLIFTVTDTGVGIPKNKLQAIFKPFVQGQSYDTRNYGGVGLGLSIVQELVNLMKGKIVVNSTVGVGSTFAVTIPLEA
ncbi:MAG TPA: HAMP domain-containing sensor histidine kinase [Nitrosomonas sp.]|nr:HAMP domain-containing sensor histidine kinase [Nitrosomonas sp.]